MTQLRLYAVTWATDTAGVSPHNNERTEVFFKGCQKATSGNACLGCFNRPLWDIAEEDRMREINTVAEQLIEHAPHKYITIGGGEPTDQPEALLALCKRLKAEGFHIMVYTWKDLRYMMLNRTGERQFFIDLLDTVDMLVDGIYDPHQRLYRPKAQDGFFSSIGSGNQTIWDAHTLKRDKTSVKGYKMRDVTAMKLDDDNGLIYLKEPQASNVICQIS